MSKPSKKTAKAATRAKAPARRVARAAKPELTPAEVEQFENHEKRYRESEQAWLRMTAPPEGEDRWSSVEEHLLDRRPDDADRRWKFFSK
ncbi:MAG: hypothetical protein SF051_01945 [Elusimicrobiota bacterium]|nr:hypothetical protein [Elusimicrobiota bacterium]